MSSPNKRISNVKKPEAIKSVNGYKAIFLNHRPDKY